MINIPALSYAPKLLLRPAEMRAVSELPNADKDRFTPIFCLGPWMSAHFLQSAFDRLKDAYGERPFFLDIDRSATLPPQGRPVREEIIALQSNEGAYRNWCDLVVSSEMAIPTIQHLDSTLDQMRLQRERFEKLDRGFAIHIQSSDSANIGAIGTLLAEIDHANLAVFVDAGWSLERNVAELWTKRVVQSLWEKKKDVPIVLLSTNFPKDFTWISGTRKVDINSRKIFSSLRAEYNDANMIYGDWGSLKPRSREIASTPAPRIDYPSKDEWVISRNKEKEWTYKDAAENLIHKSGYWKEGINVWGTYMIESTAMGDPNAISSGASVAASRCNIHLHVQANYENPLEELQTDDPWED